VRDPTVSGNHSLPSMRWDETARMYTAVREK
jgi:hypothetical protein